VKLPCACGEPHQPRFVVDGDAKPSPVRPAASTGAISQCSLNPIDATWMGQELNCLQRRLGTLDASDRLLGGF
jgi:hypothetical protein